MPRWLVGATTAPHLAQLVRGRRRRSLMLTLLKSAKAALWYKTVGPSIQPAWRISLAGLSVAQPRRHRSPSWAAGPILIGCLPLAADRATARGCPFPGRSPPKETARRVSAGGADPARNTA